LTKAACKLFHVAKICILYRNKCKRFTVETTIVTVFCTALSTPLHGLSGTLPDACNGQARHPRAEGPQPTPMRKAAFYTVKGHEMQAKRPPFAAQNTAFRKPSDYQQVTDCIQNHWLYTANCVRAKA
jgi:hypothetical protein